MFVVRADCVTYRAVSYVVWAEERHAYERAAYNAGVRHEVSLSMVPVPRAEFGQVPHKRHSHRHNANHHRGPVEVAS